MQVTEMEQIVMMSGVRDHIKRHAEKEANRGGFECVGYLAGRRGHPAVTTVVELKNHSSDPNKTFMVEPWEQWKAETDLEGAGFEIKGIYHSHPDSEAEISKSDKVGARATELLVIHSVRFDEMKGWREKEGELVPVQFAFVEALSDEEDEEEDEDA